MPKFCPIRTVSRLHPIIYVSIGAILVWAIAMLTPLWQIGIFIPILVGIAARTRKWALLSGTLSMIVGWGVYILVKILTNNALIVLDLVGGVVIGASGLAAVFVIILIVISALFGLLGGWLGGVIRSLLTNPSPQEDAVVKSSYFHK